MAKRAVLVGINYEGSPIDAPLSGCVNDVIQLKDILVQKYGFEEQNMRILIDSNNDGKYPIPNGQAIIDAISQTIEECQDGDILLIHYSGHGAQQEDASGEEADGKDEFLVGYDGTPVTDDALKRLFARVPAGVKLTMIADCCHSGTMLDQPAQDIQVQGEKSAQEDDPDFQPPEAANRAISSEQYHNFVSAHYSNPADFITAFAGIPNELADNIDAENTTSRDWMSSAFSFIKEQAELAQQEDNDVQAPTVDLDHCVLISGCMDDQTSADASFDGQASGALTWALVNVLKEKEGSISNRELIHDVRGKLAEKGFQQNPTLNCSDENAQSAFICDI